MEAKAADASEVKVAVVSAVTDPDASAGGSVGEVEMEWVKEVSPVNMAASPVVSPVVALMELVTEASQLAVADVPVARLEITVADSDIGSATTMEMDQAVSEDKTETDQVLVADLENEKVSVDRAWLMEDPALVVASGRDKEIQDLAADHLGMGTDRAMEMAPVMGTPALAGTDKAMEMATGTATATATATATVMDMVTAMDMAIAIPMEMETAMAIPMNMEIMVSAMV